jgi:hypothetical protein
VPALRVRGWRGVDRWVCVKYESSYVSSWVKGYLWGVWVRLGGGVADQGIAERWVRGLGERLQVAG